MKIETKGHSFFSENKNEELKILLINKKVDS